jgi:hypothetical protein
MTETGNNFQNLCALGRIEGRSGNGLKVRDEALSIIAHGTLRSDIQPKEDPITLTAMLGKCFIPRFIPRPRP